jgi:hypothetical protein
MTERDDLIKSLEYEIENIDLIKKRMQSAIKSIKSDDWHRIKWEMIDSKSVSQYYFGHVGSEKNPYLYIRQKVGDIWSEIILTRKQGKELLNDLIEEKL